jgi:hypothetical protein
MAINTTSSTLTVGDTMWTDHTTITDPIFWLNAKTGVVEVVNEPKATVTLNAKTRINRTTLSDCKLDDVMREVKHRITKQLFEQLVESGVIKITSETSKTTGAITFTATLEVVQYNAKA